MKTWTEHKLTTHMLKRLAQLNAPCTAGHNHGTSMGALKVRGLAEDGTPTVVGGPEPWQRRTIHVPCCRITQAGREALAQARREGW